MINRHCSRLSLYISKPFNNPRWVQSHYSIELFEISWLCAIWLKYMLTCNAWIIVLFYGYIYLLALNCIHTSYFEWWVWKKERWFDKVKGKDMMIWFINLWWYDVHVYVSMAYECHQKWFWDVFQCFQKGCHAALHYGRLLWEVQYRTILWRLLLRVKPWQLRTLQTPLDHWLRARHVHENGVPRYMDIYFQE